MSRVSKVETLISIKSEIQAQKEGQDVVRQLVFENMRITHFSPDIIKLMSRYPELSILEFNQCHVTSIEGLQGLQQVTSLGLTSNELGNECLSHIATNFPNLETLDLSGNCEVSDIKEFKVLGSLKSLKQLWVEGTKLAGTVDYRNQLFQLLDQLQVIDNINREGEEVVDDSDEEDESDEDDDEDDNDNDNDDDNDEVDEDEDDEESVEKITKKNKI